MKTTRRSFSLKALEGRFMRTVAELQEDGRILLRTQGGDSWDGPWVDLAHSHVPPSEWGLIKVHPWPARFDGGIRILSPLEVER